MIFLPNKFERFCAAIRNYVQRKALTGEINSKQKVILQKIHYAEVILTECLPQPIDICDYCYEFLKAVKTIRLSQKDKFCFEIHTQGVFLIPARPFEALLAEIAKNSNFIKIYSFKKRLIIAVTGANTSVVPLVEKIKGIKLYDLKTDTNYIIFDFSETHKESLYIKREWELLCDPFSAVNIYFPDFCP